MQDVLQVFTLTCPWCWEQYTLTLELMDEEQDFIEDCQVCCHPIQLTLGQSGDGSPYLNTRRGM